MAQRPPRAIHLDAPSLAALSPRRTHRSPKSIADTATRKAPPAPPPSFCHFRSAYVTTSQWRFNDYHE